MMEQFNQILRDHLLPKHYTDPVIHKFIGEYVVSKSLNATAKACNISKGEANNLFNRPDIYKCIQRVVETEVIKYGYDAAEVVERVKELAFVDVAEMFDDKGRIIENIHDIPPEVRRAIKKFKYKSYFEEDVNGIPQYKGKIYEVEMWDKPRSLELLGREKDTFKKTTVLQHDVSKNAAEFLLGSVTRAEQRVAELDTSLNAIDVTPVKPVSFSKPPGVR